MPLQHLWREAYSDVERWVRDSGPHTLLLDFDGTLTPIVSDPDQAYLGTTFRRVLSALQDSGEISLGIVSGRALEEVRTRVGICGIVYAGNHGMEISGPGYRFMDSAALAAQDEIRRLSFLLTYNLKGMQQVHVQNKKLSLTVHWSPPMPLYQESVIRDVVMAAASSRSDRVIIRETENSIDILPNTSWNKGSAAQWINRRFGADDRLSMYVGDDCTDEDAFKSLPDAITVKVGVANNTSARYFLENVVEVLTLLELLLVLSRRR